MLSSSSIKKRHPIFWYIEQVSVFKKHTRTPHVRIVACTAVQMLWYKQLFSEGDHLCGFSIGVEKSKPVLMLPSFLPGAWFAKLPRAEGLSADYRASMRRVSAFRSGRRFKVIASVRASSLSLCLRFPRLDELYQLTVADRKSTFQFAQFPYQRLLSFHQVCASAIPTPSSVPQVRNMI